jgi:spore coat protein CotF
MVLTEKENSLIKDMKEQEELCIKKYGKYSDEAKCPALKTLLNSLAETEREHLKTLNHIQSGSEPSSPSPLSENNSECKCSDSLYSNKEIKDHDAFLLSDLLATEKHASALYNTAIFEFKSPRVRKVLNHIQSEEQQHGEKIYAYMAMNGMYN